MGYLKILKRCCLYNNTTASTIAKFYEHAKANNFGSLGTPVSGGQAGAESGAL